MRLCRQPIPACLLLAALAWQQPAAAQGMRDPTIPPVGSGMSDGQTDAASLVRGLHGPLSVIHVNGQLQLVVGTRLFMVGQKLGDARIERISETEVWLREGGELRKVSNFVGVKRRSAQATGGEPLSECGDGAAKPAGNAGATRTPGTVEDCDITQP
jgi:hypothetical protein